ncbi:MAG: DUF721 domain-containing protein [Bacteroidia bacterium]|nr:DUF721 domain-containing protein [Bacteroidia bacterium]MDW8333672.1 DUF721 domain-containing protein [Bacteroidia bacterium]
MRKTNEYSLAAALELFMEESRLKQASVVHRVCRDWKEYVGEAVARHTEAVVFKDGTLYVRISHPAWRHEFQFFAESIRKRINDEAGAEVCRHVRWF